MLWACSTGTAAALWVKILAEGRKLLYFPINSCKFPSVQLRMVKV